ncbi:hypothetical protein B0H66DRAFT_600498 [Apodospora peruviana]|uniref:Uncharacterized protein n=1 Tax=Apodospora peruviana TaxID=516989 RepID=A0AAE0IK41_9PEZI|nr:hypothetical protein B0H66DRAFT_600498 [Apodospora peruviana]
MGVETKKKSIVPPLPAPTETESTFLSEAPTDLGTDVSRPGDDKSSYSLPSDGTPVTIKTGHRASRSQTSLLIEYFEGGKGPSGGSGSGSSEQRKPSVRVRLTPSSKHKSKSGSERGRIEITESKSRKASGRRSGGPTNGEELSALSGLSGDFEDASSYASATEESNVSRNPIEIEIDRGGNIRRRRPASPLIPAADSSSNSKTSYFPPTMSDISAIPTDSFLDGSGPATSSYKMSEIKSSRSRSPTRGGDILLGAAAGLGAAAAADKLRSKSRGENRDRDRVSVSKTRDKEKERKHRSSKSRTSSLSKEEKYAERPSSPRRRSSKGQVESVLSAADSSIVSSALSPSHRSMDQHSIRSTTSKASSINNPKLLETVEDAIRRLILPELNALKREQSKHKSRRDSTTSSATSASRDDYASDRRRSSGTDKNVTTPRDSLKIKDRRDREARNDFDDSPAQSVVSQETVEGSRHIDVTPGRSTDRLKAAAAGAALGAAAVAAHEALKSPSDDKRTRRRRRAELRGRVSDHTAHDDGDSELLAPVPPMPLMSDINASEVTRASILSADSDRPHSATEELTPIREVSRGTLSAESSPTPTRTPATTLQALGAAHANVSHGDLRALPRQRTLESDEQEDEYHHAGPSDAHEYDDEEYEETGPGYMQPGQYGLYDTQDVPPPLKYVPYQPERRGLSPIPSVSGYTEGGSEAAPNRDSRLTQRTSGSLSSPEKSPRHDRSMESPTSVRSHAMSREYGDDDGSLRSSGLEQANRMSAADSELERVTSGQAVRALGANPDFVHAMGIESNVASLVDGSMLDESVLTGDSSAVNAYNARESMATLEEERSRSHDTPTKRSVGSHREYLDERTETPVSARSQRSREVVEYDVDEYGRKIPRSTYRNSPTASETAIASAAVGAAAAIIRAQQGKGKQVQDETRASEWQPAGVQRNQSFKERAKNGQGPSLEPKHSVDRMVDERETRPKLGFNGVPDPTDPIPEFGNWQDDDELTNPSLYNGNPGHGKEAEWHGDATPRQHARDLEDDVEYEDLNDTHTSPAVQFKGSGHGLGLTTTEAAAAAAIGTAAAMAASHNHSREPSQEHHDEDWYRTSEDRKRDTLITNPYEGTSPVVNLGINDNLLAPGGYEGGFSPRSPVGHKVDEGYISQGPNKTPDAQHSKGKGVDFVVQPNMVGGGAVEDPFYTPKHTRHLSGMSHGLESPLYDAATGGGIERIESKDIIALMQHLMVRDAQRSARDTEILVTLVRSATEMRNNMEDLKRLLADTEDVIITEVKENTEKSVQRAINGPRPFPGSAARSIQGGSQTGTVNGDDVAAKKRSIFRRALKGLGAKGANDLGRIEEMLNQLLTEVDVLKAQTAPGTISSPQDEQMYDTPEGQYEQDHGYEPEGNAGTSTASHASQSGHLSIQSRGTSGKLGYDRRLSGNRISTVPEANEEEYDHGDLNEITNYSKPDMLMTLAREERGSSVPLGTPPQPAAAAQTSVSNENTPRTEEGKKHKSGTRSSWFPIPKISRWSETTTSSVAQVFRRSKQARDDDDENTPYQQTDGPSFHRAPSHSGSIGSYSDNFQFSDPHASAKIKTDKLHTGFSEQDLNHEHLDDDDDDLESPMQQPQTTHGPPPLAMNFISMTPEDPKYKAHRNSLNLQHPQPRQGQTERFKAALESQAMGFDSPISPRSADWQGSATSLTRFPRHQHHDSYSSATGEQQQNWTSSSPAQGNVMATAGGPPRPPKEPIDAPGSPGATVQNKRLSKLQKTNPGSPLPHHSVESGYGTMTHGVPTASYISQVGTARESRDGAGSPRLENRNLSGALGGNGGVARRPSGPRPMTPSGRSHGSQHSVGSGAEGGEGRRKRDTFGTVTSVDTDTF